MEEQTQKQQMFLGIIAGVSLFVAALGIANTMLMSIYERTREIGVMKVVGCYVRDIRAIFLMEAGCIGFFGGIAGILLSYLISYLMNFFGLNIGMGGASMWYGSASTGAPVSIIPGWLDRGGAINTICPLSNTSSNATGMATSGYLVEVAKVTDEEMEGWKRDYPAAFARKIDEACGICLDGWLISEKNEER